MQALATLHANAFKGLQPCSDMGSVDNFALLDCWMPTKVALVRLLIVQGEHQHKRYLIAGMHVWRALQQELMPW